MTINAAAEAARESARNTTTGRFGEQNLTDPGATVLGADFPSDDVEQAIEARTEALCNLHGEDPNNPDAWEENLEQAREEWGDPYRRLDCYPDSPGANVPVKLIEARAELIAAEAALDMTKPRQSAIALAQALAEWDDPQRRADRYADLDLPTPVRTGPITNLGDLSLTGPDRHRFTQAALDTIEHDGLPGGEWAEQEVWNLIMAKRLADKVARLFPGATRVTMESRHASSSSRLRIAAIEPYGPLDYDNSTDQLAGLLDVEADQLSRHATRWLARCDNQPRWRSETPVTFQVAAMQNITGADLDACTTEED